MSKTLIKARIRARKLVLTYFYWRIFVLRVAKNNDTLNSIVSSSRGLEDVHDTTDDNMEKETIELSDELLASFGDDIGDNLTYLAQNYFGNRDVADIDMDYAYRMVEGFDDSYESIGAEVDKHTSSFGFGQMDHMDQALFTLGYTEHRLLDTPKQVLMNEIVELAKRYGDGGSPKLLNGVLHHIVTQS